MNPMARLAIVGVVLAVTIAGVLNVFKLAATVGSPSSQPSSPGQTLGPSPTTAGSAPRDYSDLAGWIVFEHWGLAPDGSTTGFDNDRRQIWLVHADGTGLHELAPTKPADGKTSPEISPDAKTVIFSSWGPTVQVWTAGIDGGDPILVSTDCSGEENKCQETDPAFDPGGTRIAFVRTTATTSELGIRDLASGSVTLLPSTTVDLKGHQAGGLWLAQPTWSADGTQLAYDKYTMGPNGDPTTSRILIVNVDGTDVHELATPSGLPAGDADWSPDGSLIVFTTAPGDAGQGAIFTDLGIYTIRPDGSGTSKLCGPCDRGGIQPSWTPDGRHILYWGYRTFNLMDPDGSHALAINRSKLTWYGDTLGYGYLARLQPTP